MHGSSLAPPRLCTFSLEASSGDLAMTWRNSYSSTKEKKSFKISSLGDISIWILSDPNNYRHTGSNWIISTIYFDVEFPTYLGSVEKYVNDAISTLASNYSDRSQCEENFALWLETNKAKLYALKTGVTGRKRKITYDQFVQTLQNRLGRGSSKRQSTGTCRSTLLSHMVTSGSGSPRRLGTATGNSFFSIWSLSYCLLGMGHIPIGLGGDQGEKFGVYSGEFCFIMS